VNSLLTVGAISWLDDDFDKYKALLALEQSVGEALEPQHVTNWFGTVEATITLWALQGTPAFYAEAVALLRNDGRNGAALGQVRHFANRK